MTQVKDKRIARYIDIICLSICCNYQNAGLM